MAANYLTEDDDELGQYPSAANPLTAAGIDPDAARANPELLASLTPKEFGGTGDYTPQVQAQPQYQAPPPEATPSRSAVTAGAMGGVGAPAPTVTASMNPPVPPDYGRKAQEILAGDAAAATAAEKEIPTSSPEVTRLSAQRTALATAPNLYDPQTGKMVPQASEQVLGPDGKLQTVTVNPKAGVGTKIWRGIRGGLVGALTGGIPGAVVGAVEPDKIYGGTAYGAPSKAFQRLDQQRQGQLASTDADLDTSFKAWKQAVDAAKAKTGEVRADAGIGKDMGTTAAALKNADSEAQRVANESPEAKAQLSQLEFTQRQAVADKLGLKGLRRTMWLLNGKIPDPQQPNAAQVEAQQTAEGLVVYKRQHGGAEPQTPEEYQTLSDIIAARRGNLKPKGGEEGDATAQVIVDDASNKRDQFLSKWLPQGDGTYANADDPTKTLSAREFQTQSDKFANDANVKLAKLGRKIGPDGKLQATSASSSSVSPTIKSTTPPQGATGQAMGSDGKMHWVNATTHEVLGPVEQ